MSQNRNKHTRPAVRPSASKPPLQSHARKPPLHKALWPLYVLGALVVMALAAVAAFSPGATASNPSRSGTAPGAAPGAGRSTPEVSDAPRLKVDRESIDLGDIKLGNTTEVAFVLTNAGDQPLRLSEAPYIEVVEGC